MSDRPDRIDDLTEEVLPALIARLRRSRLGELEIATDGWRVRLRRDGSTVTSVAGVAAVERVADPLEAASTSQARSPGVGYFSPVTDLVLGRQVQAGDLLGHVDVLGVGQDVIAPADGIISRVTAEPGQAVEYGQVLAEIDRLERAAGTDGEGAELDDATAAP